MKTRNLGRVVACIERQGRSCACHGVFSRCNQLSTGRQRNASSSVSSNEVTKFSYMDQTWWDYRQNPLIGMNPVRVGFIVDTMKNKAKSASSNDLPLLEYKALDVGCGGGLLSESLARLGAKVTAIDPSGPLVEMAKRHARIDRRTRSIDFRSGVSVEEYLAQHSAQEEGFDVICILDVLEHTNNVESLFQAASSLLKQPSDASGEGGTLFCSTINKTWKSHAFTIVGAEYLMRYLPVGTHDWEQYLSPEDVAHLASTVGLEPVGVAGMVATQPPLFGNWQWKLDPNDTDVNWIGAYRHLSEASHAKGEPGSPEVT